MASSSLTARDAANDGDFVLVTGASGYIATHIVKQLLENGYRVRGTVRSLKDEKKIAPLMKLCENPKYPLELVEADLLKEDGWALAVKDCTYVLHTASPFPNKEPSHENELIKPAVDGTLNVLKACVIDGIKVKRVVLTSSVAAISGDTFIDSYTYTEKDWPKLDGLIAYTKSKAMAEKAAWDFVREREKNGLNCFELTTINPGYVMGPLLHDSPCTSTLIISKLMNREMPFLPDLYMPACDVRDVALSHIRAMKIQECNNNRHLIVTSFEASSLKEWALLLQAEFGPKNYSVPTTIAPNFMVRIVSIFDKSVRLITSALGRKSNYDNNRMRTVLGIEPISIKKTLIDMTYSMIERKYIPKKF